MADSDVMYRLVINFESSIDMADLLTEVGSIIEVAEADETLNGSIAMFAETVIPFGFEMAMEKDNDND